ncbi:MAG: proton-conducting transporter membrane subunit, partial [Halobacteria archaeon]|nr:proton-conducting transporter membrane subunit [Halobacteria archaeon]
MAGIEALAPVVVVGATALLILLVDTFVKGKRNGVAALLGALGLAGGFAATAYNIAAGTNAQLFEGMLVVDGFALFFYVAVLIVASLVVVASFDYIEEFYPDGYANMTEYVVLVLFATTGMMLMASSRSLVTAFIALEFTSLPSYALVAFMKRERASVEGGMKYFLLGALSS